MTGAGTAQAGREIHFVHLQLGARRATAKALTVQRLVELALVVAIPKSTNKSADTHRTGGGNGLQKFMKIFSFLDLLLPIFWICFPGGWRKVRPARPVGGQGI